MRASALEAICRMSVSLSEICGSCGAFAVSLIPGGMKIRQPGRNFAIIPVFSRSASESASHRRKALMSSNSNSQA